MKYKTLPIVAAVAATAILLAVTGGPGGWAAAGLFGVVAGYLLRRRPPDAPREFGPERFFGDAGEETALPDLRTPPANDPRMHAPARERARR